MPVHIGEMTSDVSVADESLPLSPQQVESVVSIVLERLAQQQREMRWRQEATTVETRNVATGLRPLGG